MIKMNAKTEDLIDLWPTRILKRTLNAFDEPNSQLIKLIREMEKKKKNITTDYQQNNLLNLNQPCTNWLRSNINDAVVNYFKSTLINYAIDWQIHAWPNINRLGDYHDPHNHPHSYLSGTYYLKIPSNPEIGRRPDNRPNHITLYDPRSGVNMSSIDKDLYVDPEFTVLPQPGLLMLWPAFINHFVHPNFSQKPRISISFNIVLKWSANFLPAQDY